MGVAHNAPEKVLALIVPTKLSTLSLLLYIIAY
jgi:hypothetical protein